MDPDSDPGGLKTCGSVSGFGSGSVTLFGSKADHLPGHDVGTDEEAGLQPAKLVEDLVSLVLHLPVDGQHRHSLHCDVQAKCR
jgi:hypothetical protein